MPDLVVDLEGLAGLASQLRRIQKGMETTRRQIDAARSDLGSGEVAAALENFESRWDDGRQKIDQNGQTLATMVDESVKAYRKSDTELASSLKASMHGGS